MGKYNHQNLQVLHYNKTTTFLPMLCSRPSIKDVTVPKSLSSSSFSDDPLSPKIGCMGQVKRVHNNKIIGFSPSSSSSSSSHHQNLTTITTSVHHNSKQKRLFSNTTSSSSSSRSRQGRIRGRQRSGRENEASVPVNIADMDPPLPVVKKVNRPSVDGEDNNNNLYKRRSGGITLTSLQLQHVHTSKCPLQAKTV
ncbi:hypothetical protein ACFE04_012214 [Oxalis oulophora]